MCKEFSAEMEVLFHGFPFLVAQCNRTLRGKSLFFVGFLCIRYGNPLGYCFQGRGNTPIPLPRHYTNNPFIQLLVTNLIDTLHEERHRRRLYINPRCKVEINDPIFTHNGKMRSRTSSKVKISTESSQT